MLFSIPCAGQRFDEVMHNWYDANEDMPDMNGVSANHHTYAGKIFLGLTQKLHKVEGNASEQIRLAIIAEGVTGIRANDIVSAISGHTGKVNPVSLKAEFTKAGFTETFQNTDATATTPNVTEAHGRQAGDKLTINFDAFHKGKDFEKVEIKYNGKVVTASRNRLYVEFTVEQLEDVMDVCIMPDQTAKIDLELRVYYADESGMSEEDLSERVEGVEVRGVSRINHGVPTDTWNQLSTEEQRKITSVLQFPNLDHLPGNRAIIDHISSKYFATGEFKFEKGQSVLSNSFKWVAQNPVDNCKIWLQQHVVKQATADSPDFNSAVILPTTDQSAPYKWNNDHDAKNVSQIAQHDGSTETSLKNALESNNVMPGDIIQMKGEFVTTNQHTAIIGMIEEDGLWVFDSNWEKSDTPAYHYFGYDKLNKPLTSFTIYRIVP